MNYQKLIEFLREIAKEDTEFEKDAKNIETLQQKKQELENLYAEFHEKYSKTKK